MKHDEPATPSAVADEATAGRRAAAAQAVARARGRLHVYLGVAPGAGKTYAMLAEARRLAGAGADVVVGLAETAWPR